MNGDTELGESNVPRLAQALSLRDVDGSLIALAAAGVELPVVVTCTLPLAIRADEQRLDIVAASGVLVATLCLRPRGADLYGQPINLVLSLEPGVIFAEATQARWALPVLCKTIARISAHSQAHLYREPSIGRTALHIGLVEDDNFISIMEPGVLLPHRAIVQLELGTASERRRSFDLIYADELESIDESGTFVLADDDYDEVIEFNVECPGQHSTAVFVDVEFVWDEDDKLTVRALAGGEQCIVRSDAEPERLHMAFDAKKARDLAANSSEWPNAKDGAEAEGVQRSQDLVDVPQSESVSQVATTSAFGDAGNPGKGDRLFISLCEPLFWESDEGASAALMAAGVALPARCVVEVPSSSSRVVIREGDVNGPELTLVTFGRGGDGPTDGRDHVELEVEIAPTGLIQARAGHTRFGWLPTSSTTLRLPALRSDRAFAHQEPGSDSVRKSRIPSIEQSPRDEERSANNVNAYAPQFDTGASAAQPLIVTPLVFVSYATPHVRSALSLAVAIEEQGWRAWVAARDIEAGAEWNAAILTSVHRCDCMVVMVSDLAVQSQFVKSEVHRAFELGKRVVAVMVDEHADCAQIDMRLAVTQRVRWGNGDVQTVLRAISRVPR